MLLKTEKEMTNTKPGSIEQLKILRAIEMLRNAHPDMTKLFMEGRCYAFSRFLSVLVDDNCEIHYSAKEGHIYLFWKNLWWDIRGAHLTVPADTKKIDDDGHPVFLWETCDTRRLLGIGDEHPLKNNISI